MQSHHHQFAESSTSSDDEDLAAFKAVAVSFEDLTKTLGHNSSKDDGQGQGRMASRKSTIHTAPDDEDALPEGFQQKLWRALEQQLESALQQDSDAPGSHADPQHSPLPLDGEDSQVQLFRRTPRTAIFRAQEINRKRKQHELKEPQAVNPSASGRLIMDEEDEEELLRKAMSAAVDGETILRHAAVAALAAQDNIAEPENSDSGLDDRQPIGTVTRVLRAFKAVSSPAPAKKRKAPRKEKSDEHDEGQRANSPQPDSYCEEKSPAAAGFRGLGDSVGTHSANGTPVLTEEERRARKKAKKQRQKQQHVGDAERAAKEKAKRQKKKARAKAAKQAREP